MPTYEYACSSCGHRFDVRQGFNDTPINDCPKCGASVRRVLYPAGVIFKGSGWYKTDSRPASHSEATSSSPDGGTSSTSDATDTKAPEPKKAEPKKSKTEQPAATD
ncbi:MAG TPA: FmdB family zinc ribbon protein [Thermomicrobiales bacterium]|nr:FmdB family zinc ribbon protein [Thermomicrobiales bacterium]